MKRTDILADLWREMNTCLEAADDHAMRRLKPATFMILQKFIEERIIRPLTPEAPADQPLSAPRLPRISSGPELERFERLSAADVKSGYARWAEVYGKQEAMLFGMEEAELLPRFSDLKGKRVLDIGCGTGRFTLQFAALGADTTGIDLSSEMLTIARREAVHRNLTITWIEGDLRTLSLPSGPFDLIFSSLAVTHFPDLKEFLRLLAPLLAPDGRMLISDIHPVFKQLGCSVGFLNEGTFLEIPHAWHLAADFFAAARTVGLRISDLLEFPRQTVVPMMMAVELRPLPVAC